MTELKPCPTCGSTNPLVEYTQMANDMWLCMMACTNDAPAVDFSVQGVGNTEEEAYEMACKFWNQRYETTCENADPDPIQFICSNCGVHVRNKQMGYSYVDDDGKRWYGYNGSHPFAFCPSCGRRVIEE